jgi:hypothetical protein
MWVFIYVEPPYELGFNLKERVPFLACTLSPSAAEAFPAQSFVSGLRAKATA